VFCSDVVSRPIELQAHAASTKEHDFAASSTLDDDEVIQLREWATERICHLSHRLPQDGAIETPATCSLRVAEVDISPKHIELTYERNQWRIQALESTVDLRQDGEPRQSFILTPGVEVGIGTTTLIAESERSMALREFCSRMLGWGASRLRAVDHALRAIRFAAASRSTLVLHGEEEPVSLAYALHRRVLGADAPFVVCDSRRGDLPASVRSPASRSSAMAAFELAAGGSLCVPNRGVPPDLPKLLKLLYEPEHRVQLIVCTQRRGHDELLGRLMPIEVPPIAARETELSRIVHAYAEDAMAALNTSASSFSDDDHRWVMRDARSLSEIEKATLRVVALNITHSVRQAARLLGMTQTSLSHWLDRRTPRPTRASARTPAPSAARRIRRPSRSNQSRKPTPRTPEASSPRNHD
jgi:hypothetical protein